MFNLFPPKRTVEEILDEARFKKEAENLATGVVNGVYEIIALKNELQHQLDLNKKLQAEIDKWEKDWDEQNKNISELTKEVKNLRHLKQENVDLIDRIKVLNGDCIECENEINQLILQTTALFKIIEGAKQTIDNLKKELYEVRMENNSLKVFPIEDKDDVRLQKHPMYPIHWGSLDPDIYEKAKGITIEEAIDSVKKEVSWEEAASDLALRVTSLEEQLKYTQKIVYKNDPNYEYFKKHGKWPYDGEESNPLYKNY
jgi:hypothetical protein